MPCSVETFYSIEKARSNFVLRRLYSFAYFYLLVFNEKLIRIAGEMKNLFEAFFMHTYVLILNENLNILLR